MAHLIEDVTCVAETEKAICVEGPLLDEALWVPQSQVDEDSEVWERGQSGDLLVTEWWARKQGWP